MRLPGRMVVALASTDQPDRRVHGYIASTGSMMPEYVSALGRFFPLNFLQPPTQTTLLKFRLSNLNIKIQVLKSDAPSYTTDGEIVGPSKIME